MPIGRNVEQISPELALVDERLDSSARRALPSKPGYLAAPDSPLERSAPPRLRPWPQVKRLAGTLLVVLCLGLALYALSHGSERLTGADGTSPGSAPAEATTSGADQPIDLKWKPVAGATFYNVIFWRDGVRALDLWPKSAKARVAGGRLEPGRYQWFVYPAFVTGKTRRYGPVAARGTLKV
jgi:hypothetical protein